MSAQTLAILKTALVCSVGFNAPASCAAIRAAVTNPSETRFMDSAGEWIMAHQVFLEHPWRGLTKLAKMAAIAINESLSHINRDAWGHVPLFLCVAERERPGRMDGLEDRLLRYIEAELGLTFPPHSRVFPYGRASTFIALDHAQTLIYERHVSAVLIVATDSLLTWPTLKVFEGSDRVLTDSNSNGFMPGEAGGALLVGYPTSRAETQCRGIGFGLEKAHIDSGKPLRADGLTEAINGAVADAQMEMRHLDFRITDLSGEEYYFKEAALALARTLHVRKEECDIWHPADCIGECGAVAGIAVLAVADAACRKGYAKGRNILVHAANDAGERAAAVLHYTGAA